MSLGSHEMEFVKKAAILRDRAHMLEQVRSFFKSRNVLEVDCCSLVRCPPLDANIEVMNACSDGSGERAIFIPLPNMR